MVQFNLLPDVKLEYVKTQRTKRLLTVTSIAVSMAGIVVLLLAIVSVDIVQKKSMDDLDSDIAKYSTQLKDVKDLDKILTVQNQLSTLTGLHDQKPVGTRLFSYMSQVTPARAALNQLAIDYNTHVLTIGGTAPSLDVVSTYTDTLKSTMYKAGESGDSKHAFTNVVLTAFARTQAGATFTITCNFEAPIFSSANDVTLTVPQTAGADTSGIFEGGN